MRADFRTTAGPDDENCCRKAFKVAARESDRVGSGTLPHSARRKTQQTRGGRWTARSHQRTAGVPRPTSQHARRPRQPSFQPNERARSMAETMPSQALPTPQHEPEHQGLGAANLRVRLRARRSGVQRTHRARAERRRRLPLRPEHDARDPGRFRPQPAGADPGLPRHGKVDAHRAGRGPAQLAVHPYQPRQPHQPHRPRRQGRHRAARRAAGHRVPRGHPAVGVSARLRAGVRRVRRRPPRRDVRHSAGAGGGEPSHAARPVAGAAPAPGVPPVRDVEHRRPRGHHRALPRHASRSTRGRWTAGAWSRP